MAEKATPRPWKLSFVDKWPFGLVITGSDGSEVLAQTAYCHSSKQKTRQDCIEGIGFREHGVDRGTLRAEAVAAIARQDDTARLIVQAVNSHDALVDALEHLVSDVQDYEPWQRPCLALDRAKAALALAKQEAQ